MGLILTKIVIVFAMAVIGVCANKLGVLPIESNKYLIALLMNIASPCLLITSISSTTLTDETFSITVITLVGALVYFVISMIISYIISIGIKVPKEDRGVYTGIMTMVNNGFMGIPITQASFGNDALYLMVLCNIVLCIWTFTIGFFQINLGAGKFNLGNIKSNIKSMLNPCTVFSIIGIVLLFTQTSLPYPIYSLFETIGEISIPLSMIVVGIQLGDSKLKMIIGNRKLVLASIVKLVIMPLITFGIVLLLPIDNMVKLVITFSACFPAAVNMVAVAALEKRNATLGSEGVALTTVASMITLPIAVILLTAYFRLS